jgi:hypothetical protein
VLPGSQSAAFMHTLEPLLLNARGSEGRAAARATKEEVIIWAFMMSARSSHPCNRLESGAHSSKSAPHPQARAFSYLTPCPRDLQEERCHT